MQWKKYSCGRRPEKKRSWMYPPARGPTSCGWKQGSVLPLSMRGTRRPSSSCCPKQAAICEKFTIDPLAPLWVISDRQFFGKGFFVPCGRHCATVALVTLFSAPELRMSSAASAPSRSDSREAICSRSAASGALASASANVAAAPRHAPVASASLSPRPASAAGFNSRSSIPQVMPQRCRCAVSRRDSTEMKSPAITRPCSSATACTRPCFPKRLLSSTPAHT